MAQFALAIHILLDEEGGDKVTNDPNDAGALTHWGITLTDFKEHGVDLDGDGDIDAQDLIIMNEAQAENFYNKNYWDEMQLDNLNSQAVATKVFSTGVNLGIGAIGKLLQRAVGVTVDGQIGKQTLAAANALDEKALMDQLVGRQTDYYWAITSNNITKKAYVPKSRGGLGWTQTWINRGSAACNRRDLPAIQALLSEIAAAAKAGQPVLQGNIRFIKGWLNRANQRYGI